MPPLVTERYMSPLQGAVVGICAMLTSAGLAAMTLSRVAEPQDRHYCTSLCPGAVAVGAAHFQFTGKQLVEEGIDPSTRRRALPIAVVPLQLTLSFQKLQV